MIRSFVALLLVAPCAAFAGTYSPWGLLTDEGEAWLATAAEVSSEAFGSSAHLTVGLGHGLDLTAGMNLGFETSWQLGAVEAIPRWFLGEHVGFAVRIAAEPGQPQVEVGPELHAGFEAGPLVLTTNVGWRPVEDAVFALVGPELFLTDSFSVYAEVNPALALGTGAFDVAVVPGVSLELARHALGLGAVLPVSAIDAWALGFAYATRLGARSREQ